MHLTSRTPCKLCARGAVFQPTFLCVVLPRIIVWGSCFLLCALAVRDRLRTQLSLPQFCHTRTQLCHTHTRNFVTYNFVTHNFSSHATLTHTQHFVTHLVTCMAGAALTALGWLWWRTWSALSPGASRGSRRGSICPGRRGTLRGRRGVW